VKTPNNFCCCYDRGKPQRIFYAFLFVKHVHYARADLVVTYIHNRILCSPRSVSEHTRRARGQEETMARFLPMLCPVALLNAVKISGGAMGCTLPPLTGAVR
jgi:hypothetical protein